MHILKRSSKLIEGINKRATSLSSTNDFCRSCFSKYRNKSNSDCIASTAVPGSLIPGLNALIAISLLTLGCQIAAYVPNFRNFLMYVSLFMRLVLTPIIALVILKLLQFEGVLAQALLISTAMPTAVYSSIIAQEYNNEPQFAAQTVVISTILSSLTLTLVIFVAMNMF